MADAKICDLCGELAKDPYEAQMHVLYYEDNTSRFFGIPKKSLPIQIDICGKCWDKLRGLAGGGDDGE